jgi:hypothetical protein
MYHFRGDADIDDPQDPAHVRTAVDIMAGLGATEGYGVVGPDALAEDSTAVRIKTGWNIHRYDGNGSGELGLIDEVDDVGEMAVDVAAETGPEKGIDNGITGKTSGFDLFEKDRDGADPHLVVDDMEGQFEFFDDLEVDCGIAGENIRVDQDEKDRLAPSLVEVTTDDEAVAAVVAGTDKNQGEGVFAGAEIPDHLMDGPKSGVFHQDDPGNPEIFDGAAIESPHLNGCRQFHDTFLRLCRSQAK